MGKRKKIFKNKDTDIEAVTGNVSEGHRNPFTRILSKRKKTSKEETDTETGSEGGSGGSGGRKSKRDPITIDVDTSPPKRSRSILIAETKAMERSRRMAEQQGERRLASVKARDHSSENDVQQSPEGELQNSILQHPALDSQRFDGIDPNLNPEPPLNTEARREYDNERREQDKEKQLRLGNMPKFRTAPTPQGPS
jgi:hypothetical protein